MTMQIEDKIEYLNDQYTIIKCEKDEIFEPGDYGFSPTPLSTACLKGYFCKYSIENDYLILFQLNIGLETENPPVLQGISATNIEEHSSNWMFEKVNLPLNYSGGIIIGRNVVDEIYNPFGFWRPHCYEYVFELIFEKGRLVKTFDHCKYMLLIREIIRNSRQVVKKSIGYFEEDQTVIIKAPNQQDLKSFSLLVKEIASKYISSKTIELFNSLKSKGYIELDKKLHFGEYRNLSTCFEKNGFRNIVLTKYSTDSQEHLELDLVIAQCPDSVQLLNIYNKYNLGTSFNLLL